MEKQVDQVNYTLSYSVYGKGKPVVVLVHGFAATGKVWQKQYEFLSPSCTVIVPDLPGSGNSTFKNIENLSLIKENDACHIDFYADCLKEMLQKENIKQCIMLGHSMGGYITLAFAGKYPSFLKAFGLINSTAFADNEEKKTVRLKAIETIETYGGYTFLQKTISSLFGEAFKKSHPHVIEELIESSKKFPDKILEDYYRAMMNRQERTQVLSAAKIPVLFVMGEEDKPAPPTDVLQQVHLPEISYIHMLEETGHMSMLEAPEKLNNHLHNFIHSQLL